MENHLPNILAGALVILAISVLFLFRKFCTYPKQSPASIHLTENKKNIRAVLGLNSSVYLFFIIIFSITAALFFLLPGFLALRHFLGSDLETRAVLEVCVFWMFFGLLWFYLLRKKHLELPEKYEEFGVKKEIKK